MSYTKQFIEDNPGKNFDGSPLKVVEPTDELVMPTSSFQKELFRQSVKDKIMNGTLNPLEFYRQAKLMSDCIDDLKKDPDILDCAHSEVLKYGKEKPSVNGAIVTMSSRSTPEYSTCGDPVYDELKEKLKAREQFLKSLPSEGTVDPGTGLLIKPPVTRESSFITVKI